MVGPGGKEGSEERCQAACPELLALGQVITCQGLLGCGTRSSELCRHCALTLHKSCSRGRSYHRSTFSLVSASRPELGVCSGPDQQQEWRLRLRAHLEGLHEGPEENADGVTLSEEFDESGSTEEAEKAQVDEIILRR